MHIATTARIHPAAVLHGDIEIGANVTVGPGAVLEGKVRVGPDCVIRPGAIIVGETFLGRGNQVYPGAVIGEKPQHLRYADEPTRVEIGDFNILREHVTIHRGTTASMVTRLGNHNFLMAGAHVAHDCVVGNRCILANNAVLGGHCVIDDCVFLSAHSALHQFVRVGRLAMISGVSASSKDVPPFITQQGINNVVGINLVGLRRAGMNSEQIHAIHAAFRLLFREGLALTAAIERMQSDLGHFDVIQEMIAFLEKCAKGINYMRGRMQSDAA